MQAQFGGSLREDLLGYLAVACAEGCVDRFVCEVLEVCAGPVLEDGAYSVQIVVAEDVLLAAEVVFQDIEAVLLIWQGNADLKVESPRPEQGLIDHFHSVG